MNVGQAKILLDKVNALFKSISIDDAGPSAIERDLMLSYVRQLYDACLSSELVAPVVPPPPAPGPKPAPAPRPEPIVKKYVPPVVETPAPKPPAPAPAPEPEPVKPPVAQVEPPLVRPEPIPTPPPPVEPEKKAAPEPPARPVATSKSSNSKAIEALFEARAAKELSEKLGERRIEDLTRAMSINDKLLYINDLFGKDQTAMDETLKLLNRYESLEDAKGLLVNLAEQYNWVDEERQETARHFIKLVRRRYV